MQTQFGMASKLTLNLLNVYTLPMSLAWRRTKLRRRAKVGAVVGRRVILHIFQLLQEPIQVDPQEGETIAQILHRDLARAPLEPKMPLRPQMSTLSSCRTSWKDLADQ